MQDIRKQFSLGWLSGADEPSVSSSTDRGDSGLEEAMMFYGGPVLKQLRQYQGTEVGLHDLAKSVKDEVPNFQFDLLWPVIRNLANKSLVEIVDTSDPTGDYRIRLGVRAAP